MPEASHARARLLTVAENFTTEARVLQTWMNYIPDWLRDHPGINRVRLLDSEHMGLDHCHTPASYSELAIAIGNMDESEVRKAPQVDGNVYMPPWCFCVQAPSVLETLLKRMFLIYLALYLTTQFPDLQFVIESNDEFFCGRINKPPLWMNIPEKSGIGVLRGTIPAQLGSFHTQTEISMGLLATFILNTIGEGRKTGRDYFPQTKRGVLRMKLKKLEEEGRLFMVSEPMAPRYLAAPPGLLLAHKQAEQPPGEHRNDVLQKLKAGIPQHSILNTTTTAQQKSERRTSRQAQSPEELRGEIQEDSDIRITM